MSRKRSGKRIFIVTQEFPQAVVRTRRWVEAENKDEAGNSPEELPAYHEEQDVDLGGEARTISVDEVKDEASLTALRKRTGQ